MIDSSGDLDGVWDAAGTYTPTLDKFTLCDKVAIYGGFAGNENPQTFDPENDVRDFVANKTIRDGGNTQAVSVYVANVGCDTRLDDFALTGATLHAIHNDHNGVGGASPTLRNLIVENNVGDNGSGLCNDSECNALREKCVLCRKTGGVGIAVYIIGRTCEPIRILRCEF